ncbi:hypothetical protein P171DRAFT_436558 [Karstenula rhodostoma CBS 690.94]|uniref:Alcohol acetyltransferase n=1 Tax=Karstenula rhodostoma CBS 690.94 TaxID=1392251 RepID=A0A9P4U7K1_9PLEO|nr:hypothetical protein P171DRAFT_436558 [Karstenula rhodostoma CBS 690.94]
MSISQLKKLRAAGKLEEMAAVAHELDLYTTAGFSVHYKASQALPAPDIEPLIYHALAQVLHELPTLFAVPIVAEGEETYFARLPSIDLRKVTTFVQREKPVPDDGNGRDAELDALLQTQVNTNFKSNEGIQPVWRFIVLYDYAAQQAFTANFMVHHAIADGASFQLLHRAFHKALHTLSSPSSTPHSEISYLISPNNEDAIGPPIEAIHSLQLPPSSPPQPNAPNHNDWLGNPPSFPHATGYTTLTLSPAMLHAWTHECRAHRVAPPAALNALLTRTIYAALPATTESMDINIPVDVRSSLPPAAVDGAMGNFFDAFRVRVFRRDFLAQEADAEEGELGDFWCVARKVTAETRQYFSRTGDDGEAQLNIAGLKNVPDLHALLTSLVGGPRSESLELAYIGPHVPYADGSTLRWQAGRATVSRCAFALGACLQMTVVLHGEGMTIGFAWPRGAIGDELVEETIKGVREYFVGITKGAA